MALVDSTGRLFGKINVFDAALMLVFALIAAGIIAVQSGWHETSGEVVNGETDIEYSFLMHNAKTLRPDLFKPGKKISMTIRNQPRGEVTIVKSEVSPKKAIIQNASGQFTLVDDPSDPHGYEYLVTVKDHAVVTDQGYVTDGVKVKIGMTIDVEGFDFRFPAVIVDVHEDKATGSSKAPAQQGKSRV
ncbi:MAG: DUF4330 domain-containing protein [Vampirovibrionales bacterium]|nr:DUF4330 domain-containing protein [Vampirovibrionales bacterium]